MEEFINNFQDLSPYKLQASLSTRYYEYARQAIKEFFSDPSITNIIYGWSSGEYRSHHLVRHSNGNIYGVHYAYGELTNAYYFTEEELDDYFNGYEKEKPLFRESREIEKFKNKNDLIFNDQKIV